MILHWPTQMLMLAGCFLGKLLLSVYHQCKLLSSCWLNLFILTLWLGRRGSINKRNYVKKFFFLSFKLHYSGLLTFTDMSLFQLEFEMYNHLVNRSVISVAMWSCIYYYLVGNTIWGVIETLFISGKVALKIATPYS